MNKGWNPIEIEYNKIQNHQHFIEKIIDGRSPALIIRNFYDSDACEIISNRIKDFFYSDQRAGFIKKIGTFLLGYINQKSDYFSEAEKARQTLRKIFAGMEDPRKKIHYLASLLFPSKEITVATEGDKKYACGIIRLHENGDFAPIHRDNVRFEARNFDVAKFSIQLSTVLYLQQTEKGGELVLHKQSWKKSDEKFRNIGFGYSRDVIANCKQFVKIKPNQGDLVIINPIFYHEILTVLGKTRRITLGLFMAFSRIGSRVVTWS